MADVAIDAVAVTMVMVVMPVCMIVAVMMMIMIMIMIMIVRMVVAGLFFIQRITKFGVVVMNFHFAARKPGLERRHQILWFDDAARFCFLNALDKRVDDVVLVGEIMRFEELYVWRRFRDPIDISVNPVDELPRKQEIGRDHDLLVTQL